MTPRLGIGLDIGGTKVLGAIVDDTGDVCSPTMPAMSG